MKSTVFIHRTHFFLLFHPSYTITCTLCTCNWIIIIVLTYYAVLDKTLIDLRAFLSFFFVVFSLLLSIYVFNCGFSNRSNPRTLYLPRHFLYFNIRGYVYCNLLMFPPACLLYLNDPIERFSLCTYTNTIMYKRNILYLLQVICRNS